MPDKKMNKLKPELGDTLTDKIDPYVPLSEFEKPIAEEEAKKRKYFEDIILPMSKKQFGVK